MPIKVLHIQSFDWGGAAIAARRLHEGLINTGVESAMLLKWKSKFNVHNTYEYKAPPEIYTFSRKLKNKLKQIKRIIKTEAPLPDYLANAHEGYHQFTLPQ